jgi:hypothetical protein
VNKNIVAALMALFVVFVGFQFAEPAAAVKVVDHGTKYVWNGKEGGWMKITWKAYQYNNNYLKIYKKSYLKDPNTKKHYISVYEKWVLTKTTKNSVKITDWLYGSDIDPEKSVVYDKTKLTAAQYYWRIFKYTYMGI